VLDDEGLILVEGAFSRQLPACAISVRMKILNAGNGDRAPDLRYRYTFLIVKRIVSILLLIFLAAALGFPDETSFHTVMVPNLKGKQIKAVLTFSDKDKAVEVHPVKGAAVTIPYAQIDKCAYEYTDALMGARNYWLEIDYHDHDARKVLVLLMDSHNYLRILDSLKTHTGIDAEVLGNARKR
jgi:hypothetical protein